MRMDRQTLKDQDVVMDDNQYHDCTFENCKLIFRGGTPPTIVGCHLNDCSWHFEDAADRTLLFMRMLYHGLGPGGPELIEGTIEAIRMPFPETQSG